MNKAWALGLALLAALPAHADIWGYVDDKGVAHFAAEKQDERYELFFLGGESFDSRTGVPAPVPDTGPKAAPPHRLLAVLDVSPGFRRVQPHLREAAQDLGIDFELLQALIATESGFDPEAVSPKGAIGLMQVKPATAQRYGLRGDDRTPLARKLADPRTNIRTGTRYLRDLLRLFPGRLELVLAAYNAGEGAVRRAGNRVPDYPETRNYVRTVLQLYALLKPGPTAAAGAAGTRWPSRVRMEIPGVPPQAAHAAPAGGALGRGNLPPASRSAEHD